MKNTLIIITFLFIYKISFAQASSDDNFILSSPDHPTTIFVAKDEKEVVKITANALAGDIRDITGRKPLVTDDTGNLKGSVVILGTITNPYIQHFLKKYHLPDIKGTWEHFFIRVLNNNTNRKILLIAGSDARGAAYGAFTISRLIGVSPWKWWADVAPHKEKELVINKDIHIEQGPSVKYRGIFLNDEDWGLSPWASKTFEPELGTIGPKTYAKIYELLLRLKANTIWPAMHPSTMPFFEVRGNEAMATKYDIIVGTAHNEPMMLNSPRRWHAKTMGPFNYVTNRDTVLAHWRSMVMRVARDNDIYTLGMRGTGDTRMEGVSTLSQAAAVLEKVFKDQRSLLQEYVNPDVSKVPQVFVPYKEVLPVYDHGLKVPDDVTLMWPDDNYGYIRRLSDRKERQRSGSSGIYYHVSYNGSPQDYLWLSTTQPGLIWEEMKKAWDYGAKRIWIVNVGDIKPTAYDIEFFLDMAWNINSIKPDNILHYMRQWHNKIFGQQNAAAITNVMNEYYRLAFIRRPEFMGWNRTYPNTPTRNTAFRPFLDGDEIAGRVNAYKQLIQKVEQIKKNIPADLQNAYFELVTYPVEAAAYMNEKFLYAQKSRLFAQYNLPVANDYASWSQQAYDSIKILTDEYNDLDNGKWKYMMDRAPRNLPVFKLPELPEKVHSDQKGIVVWLEGQSTPAQKQLQDTLPVFNPYNAKHHFIALLNKGSQPVKWQAATDQDWIHLNQSSGALQTEDKIEVTINWNKLPAAIREGALTLKTQDSSFKIYVQIAPPMKGRISPNPIVEQDGHVFIQAYQFIKKYNYSKTHQWEPVQELGYSDSAYSILPVPVADTQKLHTAYLEYKFYTYSKGPAEITAFTLPTEPVNNKHGMRIAVSFDHGQKHIISYQTKAGSKQWQQNVLSNHARCSLNYNFSTTGWHTIKIYPLDPGVVLDQILINFKPDQKIYAVPVMYNH